MAAMADGDPRQQEMLTARPGRKVAWVGFCFGLIGLFAGILLWASYVRLAFRKSDWAWLESQPLTVTGTASPGIALLGMLVCCFVLLLTPRQPHGRNGRGLAWAGLAMSLLGLSVLYPWFACGRDMAKRSLCMANMSGIAKAMRVYASSPRYGQDRRDYPPDIESVLRIWPHSGPMFVCPGTGVVCRDNWYRYIPGSWDTEDARNVLLYEKQWDHLSDGGNILFADLHAEWVQPYLRVLELVEQTKQRLAMRGERRCQRASEGAIGNNRHGLGGFAAGDRTAKTYRSQRRPTALVTKAEFERASSPRLESLGYHHAVPTGRKGANCAMPAP